MMRRLLPMLKFGGRWLGPVLLLVAAYLFILPPMPFVDFSGLPALAGAAITTITCIFLRAPERQKRRKVLAIAALSAFIFTGWRFWEDKAGYHEQTVSFTNRGARLVGTLYLPDRSGKVPGIVWVHGSGPATRFSGQPFGKHFAQSGYAVLVVDKRGAGESTGQFGGGTREICPENVNLLASDASAALSFLGKRPEVGGDMVGFVGASQAGWITPRGAVLNGHAAFMLLLSGPTTSAHAFLRYEQFRLGVECGRVVTISWRTT